MSKTRHLTRLAAPRTWPVKRKVTKWIARPMPGAHNINKALPLVVVIRDILKLTSNRKELQSLLNSKSILVNNKPVRDVRFATGLFDVIALPKLKVQYRIVLNTQGKLTIIKIADNEANTLLLRVDNKCSISKKKTQLNLNNGWNLLVEKDEYHTNDVLVYDTKSKKIQSKLRVEKGASVYLIGGKHAGRLAKFVGIQETGTLRKHKIAKLIVDTEESKIRSSAKSKGLAGKKELDSALRNIIIVGKDKPLINLTN